MSYFELIQLGQTTKCTNNDDKQPISKTYWYKYIMIVDQQNKAYRQDAQ